MLNRRLVQSLRLVFALTVSAVIPGTVSAMCGKGRLILDGELTVTEVIFLSGEAAVVNGIDFPYKSVPGGGNCMVNAYINIPGVGAGIYDYNLNPPSFPQDFEFGNVVFYEVGASADIGGRGNLLSKVSLGVTLSSLGTVPSFPQVGALEFRVEPDEFFFAPTVFLAKVDVYVEDVAVISMIPVLFK